jgi:5-methylcytosine-specific restriction endonuclease McrA
MLNHKISDTLVLNRDMRPVKIVPGLTTVPWHAAIKLIYGEHAQVVHEYQDWEVHSPSTTLKVPSVIMVRKYVHFVPQIPWREELLFLRDRFRCQYCKQRFPMQNLTLDHVVPRTYGGKTCWENIVAACAPCNHTRGHNTKIKPVIVPYKPSYWELVEKAKELPLVVPDESWVPYLDWPEENLFVRGKSNEILHDRLAA